MGKMMALAGPGGLGLGVEYHGAGTTFTTADGTSTFVLLSEGSGNLIKWQTGGDSDIWLRVGTQLRPVPANGWVYTLQDTGFLSSSDDPNSRTTLEMQQAEPVTEALPPPTPVTILAPEPELELTFTPEPTIPPSIKPPTPAPLPNGELEIIYGSAKEHILPGAPATPPPANGAASEIPLWMWIVGGGAALYLFSRR